MSMFTALESLKTALLLCPTIVAAAAQDPPIGSVKIGREAGISPKDYPLIRIVPSLVPVGPYGKRLGSVLIYFGMNVHPSLGLETVYEAMSEMEEEIFIALRPFPGRILETAWDGDEFLPFKNAAIRCELHWDAAQPPPPPPPPPAPAPAPPPP